MKIKHIIIAVGLLLLASCVKEQLDTPPGPQPPASLVFRTLASDTGFAVGDEIGIFMLQKDIAGHDSVIAGGNSIPSDNRRYIVQADSTLTPAAAAQKIEFPQNNEAVDFVAYYPHRALADQFYPLDMNAAVPVDLMRAERRGMRRDNPKVSLRFDHVLARLTLQITLSPTIETPGTVTAAIDSMPPIASFNLFADTLNVAPNDTIRMRGITPAISADTAFTTMVIPHAARDNRTIIFTMGDKKYRWRVPADSAFVRGKHYLYTLTLTNNSEVSVTSGSIVGWDTSGPSIPVTAD